MSVTAQPKKGRLVLPPARTWPALYRTLDLRVGGVAARVLVETVLGARAALLRRSNEEVAPHDLRRLAALASRVEAGEPLQHVVGEWSFRRLEVAVDGRALVPRPETEVVAGVALAELQRAVEARGVPRLALDLGTGSGVIACALVDEDPMVQVVASDRSLAALSLAAENRSRLDPSTARRLRLVAADWYGPLSAKGRFGLVVANPPYLAEHELSRLDPVVRCYDPPEALVAGPDGFEAIAAVLEGAPRLVAPGGRVVVELAPPQAGRAIAAATDVGATAVRIEEDLAGRPRVLVAAF